MSPKPRGLTVADLVPDPDNRRQHNARNIGVVVESLHSVGAARSIVIDEDNVVLAGNGLIEAAGVAGITRVRVIEADGDEIIAVRRSGLSAEKKRALAIADNRAGELSEWKPEQVAADLAQGLDFSPWFSNEELGRIQPKARQRHHHVGQEPEREDLLGYAIDRDGLTGRSLLDQRRQHGVELVKRLKDAEGRLDEETGFWVARLVEMVQQARRPFLGVINAPSSGKRAYHFATDLAQRIAATLGVPHVVALANPAPRGTRQSIHAKLGETAAAYQVVADLPAGDWILADDVYCTGRTALACRAVLPDHVTLWLCALSRS